MEPGLKQMHKSCLRCGRQLKSRRSQEKGYGPVCAERAKVDPNLIDLLNESQEQKVMAG